jgi:mxaD protein
MKRLLLWALSALCLASFSARADGPLNSYQTVDVKASIQDVWDAVKDFDSLQKWHPIFGNDQLKSGGNGQVGSVRTLTVKEGPSFDEELTAYDDVDRRYTYRIIDPSPLPVKEYVSTLQVLEGRRGYNTVVWRGSYRNNSEGKMKDEEVLGFIDGVYRAGLDQLKYLLESR